MHQRTPTRSHTEMYESKYGDDDDIMYALYFMFKISFFRGPPLRARPN